MADSPLARCTLRVIHARELSMQLLSLQSRWRKLWSLALVAGGAQRWRANVRRSQRPYANRSQQRILARQRALFVGLYAHRRRRMLSHLSN
jgi:hypothetical protein